MNLNNKSEQLRSWSQCWTNAMAVYPDFRDAVLKEDEFFDKYGNQGLFGSNVTVGGCGDGREIMNILNANRNSSVIKRITGVDLLQVSLNQVRDLLLANSELVEDVSVDLIHGDVTQTTIEHGSQDAFVFMLTMANFTDSQIDNLFGHVSEILVSNGMFVFSIYNQNAFNTRYEMYMDINAPIESFCAQTGFVKFVSGFEEASFSRQYSTSQVLDMVSRNGFLVDYIDGVGMTNLVVARKKN